MSPYVIPGIKTDIRYPYAIIIETCKEFNIPTQMIVSKTRKYKFLIARQCATYLIRKKYPYMTLIEIGKLFGRTYDHTTIINSIKRIENEIYNKTDIAQKVEKINRQIAIQNYAA
jgi:chromosomal replication initiator protein